MHCIYHLVSLLCVHVLRVKLKGRARFSLPTENLAFKQCRFSQGLPGIWGEGRLSGKESVCQCRRHGTHRFNSWVRKICWRRKWPSTPVFLPGKSHGQRSLTSYSSWVAKSGTWLSDWTTTKEQLDEDVGVRGWKKTDVMAAGRGREGRFVWGSFCWEENVNLFVPFFCEILELRAWCNLQGEERVGKDGMARRRVMWKGTQTLRAARGTEGF